MHRRTLLAILEAHLVRHPEDQIRVDHVRQFVRVHADCFARTCVEGHVTASAWILSPDHRRVLLVHHRKLDRWLQPGGHADGDPDPLGVALREAREESGLERLGPLAGRAPTWPLDVDVHVIPARAGEPAHLHHDVRYLFVAAPDEVPRLSAESRAIRWFDVTDLASAGADDGMLRMALRTRALLGG